MSFEKLKNCMKIVENKYKLDEIGYGQSEKGSEKYTNSYPHLLQKII